MRRIDVPLAGRSYGVVVGAGVLDRAGLLLEPLLVGKRAFVATDANVADFGYLGRLERALGERWAGSHVLAPGEEHKDWRSLEALLDAALEAGADRGDLLIALGGGVVGDVAGLAAALLKRGCGYVQIPTTLLAQVDSSVGGKTAINSRHGKNLIGTFHQPAAVLIDPETLDTLDERELRAGYAEVVKYGLIADPGFFAWCETNAAGLLGGDGETRVHAIEMSLRAKAAIVAADERETSGVRALLNLGHTFGHALEAETGFSDRLLHGEAVAIGMAMAFRLSAELGLCAPEEADQVEAHLRSVGLAVSPRGLADGLRLFKAMQQDKKWHGGRPTLILTRGIGRAFVADVDPGELQSFLANCS